jgi:hypothetical protein
MLAKSATIFGADIGVYVLGRDGEPNADTTFAWAIADLDSVSRCPTTEDGGGRNQSTEGRSIRVLANAVAAALEHDGSVALGFEAPMWLPIHTQVPQSAFRLFSPRFPQEARREWYLQSGAAATLKAVGLGALLFSELGQQGVKPILTTNASHWKDTAGAILVFEAFVTGEYKPQPPQGCSSHRWDAWLAALAYSLHLSKESHPEWTLELLATATEDSESVLSVWGIIAQTAGLDSAHCKGRCDVVAVRRRTDAQAGAAAEPQDDLSVLALAIE